MGAGWGRLAKKEGAHQCQLEAPWLSWGPAVSLLLHDKKSESGIHYWGLRTLPALWNNLQDGQCTEGTTWRGKKGGQGTARVLLEGCLVDRCSLGREGRSCRS